MSKKDILAYLIESNLSISTFQLVISILVSLVFGMFIYYIYRVTYTGSAYSKTFAQGLAQMAIVTTIIMLTIQSNLALSLGMVGSLSIIRFRTAIKDPKDMIFIFWSISVGVGCGAAIFVPVVFGSVILAVLFFVFKKETYERTTYLLVLKCIDKEAVNEADAEEGVKNLLKASTRNFKTKTCSYSFGFKEITYEIVLKETEVSALLKQIKEINGIESVNAVSYSGEILG